MEGDPPGGSMAVQQKAAGVTPSNKNSISQKQVFDKKKYIGLSIGFAEDLTSAHGNRLNTKHDAESLMCSAKRASF